MTAQAIYANITAVEGPQNSGYLERLEAISGQFVGSIEARELRNNNEVSQFSCVGDMDADITTTLGSGDFPGNLADPLIITGGDFPEERELSVTSLAAYDGRIEIREVAGTSQGGHLYGDMLFGGGINDADRDIIIDNGLCGLFRIGYDLAGDIRIYGTPGLTDEGLTGQVIVNGKNWGDGDPYGKWTGSVTIGPDVDPNEVYPITLAPIPYYDNPSSEVGGGAVGRVPFYLHYGDCSPSGVKRNEASNGLDGLGLCEYGFHAQKRVPKDTSWNSVTLMHLGPIAQEGAGKPFKVWRKGLMSLCGWEDRTADFTYTMRPNGVDRAIQINGSFEGGYDWLIEPNTGGSDFLYCAELEESVGKVPVLDYDYRLRVLELQDTTANGLIQPDDITAWLANPIDTTLDGITDSADLIDVTEAVAESGDW